MLKRAANLYEEASLKDMHKELSTALAFFYQFVLGLAGRQFMFQ